MSTQTLHSFPIRTEDTRTPRIAVIGITLLAALVIAVTNLVSASQNAWLLNYHDRGHPEEQERLVALRDTDTENPAERRLRNTQLVELGVVHARRTADYNALLTKNRALARIWPWKWLIAPVPTRLTSL